MQSRDLLFIFQVLTLLAVGLNIFLVRQVFSFVFLTFIPGFLILKLLKINLSFLKTILLSLGLSLAFLMFFGLLLNTLLSVMGVLDPLSTFNIVVSVSLVTLLLSALLYKREKPKDFSISIKLPRFAILLLAIPFLTILGSELANVNKNTILLMLLTVLSMIIVFCVFFKRLLPLKIYPLALFSIAFFLLIGTSLVSNYLLGADVQIETYFATLTYTNSFWDWTIPHAYNGMLSVTVLPVIFSKFMNISIVWVFKLAYPLIYSLVPIGLFLAYRKQTNPIVAFLAVFFFISIDTFFLQMLGLARQMIAEVFLVLLVLLFVEEKLEISKKRWLFIVFSVGLIVSHYSIAYLFTFLILLSLLLSRFFNRADHKSKPVIVPVTVLGYIAAIFGWNLLVVPAAFNSLWVWVMYVSNEVFELAQTPGIEGLMPAYLSPLHNVSRYVFLLLQGLIVLGFIGLLFRRNTKFNAEYSVMCMGGMAVLLMSMLIPSFASSGLNITRFYHLSLFFLAPLCITGFIYIVGLAIKIRVRIFPLRMNINRTLRKKFKMACLILMAILLVSLFAFQVGFVYEVADDVPTSISLSMDRPDSWTLYLNQLYINPEEVYASKWLGVNGGNENSCIWRLRFQILDQLWLNRPCERKVFGAGHSKQY